MGIFHPGIPKELALFLRDTFKVTTLIETGTQHGYSAEWAAQYFDKVVTIELSKELHRQAQARLAKYQNIVSVCGDSAAELARLVTSLEIPAIFWLDAHWSLQNTAGQENPCPLLDELRIILNRGSSHFLLIDDARLFGFPPSFPHPYRSWPNFTDIHELIKQYGIVKFFLFDDTIVIPPAEHASIVEKHLQVLDTLRSNNNCKYPYSESDITRIGVASVERLIDDKVLGNAAEECQRILKSTDQPAPFHFLLYKIYREQYRDDAIVELQKAVTAAPIHHTYRLEYADQLRRTGNAAEAKEQFEWAVATKLVRNKVAELSE